MKKLETPERIRSALACQIGTEHYWKVFPDDDAFKITDGVKMMAEMCEAFWLVADILACQQTQKAKREDNLLHLRLRLDLILLQRVK